MWCTESKGHVSSRRATEVVAELYTTLRSNSQWLNEPLSKVFLTNLIFEYDCTERKGVMALRTLLFCDAHSKGSAYVKNSTTVALTTMITQQHR